MLVLRRFRGANNKRQLATEEEVLAAIDKGLEMKACEKEVSILETAELASRHIALPVGYIVLFVRKMSCDERSKRKIREPRRHHANS